VTEAIVVMVTCVGSAQARGIANRLLEERLVACANIVSRIRSLFHWQGAISREWESLLLMKTRANLFDALSKRVRELHSYQVPEIIAMPIVAGSQDYLDWIQQSTAKEQ